MAAEKKWNLQSFATNANVFGTNQTYTITCAGSNTFMNLNQADLIMNLSITNFNPLTQTYSIIRPTVAWISQINTTITFATKEGPLIINYSGYNNRGIAANVLETLEYSKAKWDQYNPIEYLSPQGNLSNSNFEVLIPLKFLNDSSYDAGLLNIETISFNISWESQTKIFDFGTLTSAGVQTNRVDIKYPTITVSNTDMIPPSVREIPNRQVYIASIDLNGGNSAANGTVSVPFPASVLYYFFTGVGDLYTLNPNPQSVVTNHSLTSMGQVYPLISNYNAKFNSSGNEVGLLRHYIELMDISGKDKPENNSILSYPYWRDEARIYTIEIGTEQKNGQQYNFATNFSQSTSIPSTCVLVFLGRRSLNIIS